VLLFTSIDLALPRNSGMDIVSYQRKYTRMRIGQLIVFYALLFGILSCDKRDRNNKHDESKKDRAVEGKLLFAEGKKLGALKNKKLNEVSGLAASIVNPGLLWTLNDSGNEPEVYLIDAETNIKRTYVLEGVSNRDWEEITLGPGPKPGKTYLYVGDIGDNLAAHKYKYIYRFEEPLYNADAGKGKIEITNFDTIVFSLSDEERDTEAFVVDPLTRDIYIISKWSRPVDLYQLKTTPAQHDTAIAQHIGTLPISIVVAADFSRDGSELLIKTINDVFYWKRPADMTVSAMLQEPGRSLPYSREPQGESVAWSATGDGYYTLSEQKDGEQIHMMFYQRK
jgi:hypothetical protein